MENKLMAGFARVDATPMLGIRLEGNYHTRRAEAVMDAIELCAIAFASGEARTVIITMDACHIPTDAADDLRRHAARVHGLPVEAVYLHSTHTHTAPFVLLEGADPLEQEYYRFLRRKMADVTGFALEDLKPAKMGCAVGQAPEVSFIRRYIMKDGSARTNPGIGNPDVDHPIGVADHRVNLLRFNREGADTLLLVNYGNHPDTIGGNKISGDWPAFVRRQVEQAMPDTKCIFLNGAQGDVNHVNVRPPFPQEELMYPVEHRQRGHRFSQALARAISGTVLQLFDRTRYTPVDSIRIRQAFVRLATNMPKPEEMAEAHRINDLYEAGRAEELPGSGMEWNTVIAEAIRQVQLEHGPEFVEMPITGIALGNIALVGIPGEPFSAIGLALKEAPHWDLVLPCCTVNGYYGYFPTKDAFGVGGYEARTSRFRAGVAERIIRDGTELLSALR